MTRDEVLHEFSRWTGHPNPPRPLQTYWYDTDAMADEIMRLRQENEALHSRVISGNLEDRSAIHQLQDLILRHEEVNDRLRRILAALRKPSEAVIEAAESCYRDEVVVGALRRTIQAAVAAAEQEASHER